MNHSLGKVYLIGAGPGAEDLITVRGAEILKRADVVFYDALVSLSTLAYCQKAEKIAVGKRCGQFSTAQVFINQRLITAAHQYQTIVRLKGGDPMMFGRADEEITALKKAGVCVEVVPGITAALSAAASLQQSLTLRGVSRSVAFVTYSQAKMENTETAPPVCAHADTLMIYMGRDQAAAIASRLIADGWSATTPAVIMESISGKNERHCRLSLQDMKNGKSHEWLLQGKINPDSPLHQKALNGKSGINVDYEEPSPPVLLLVGKVFGASFKTNEDNDFQNIPSSNHPTAYFPSAKIKAFA